jgi:hypothetical protein
MTLSVLAQGDSLVALPGHRRAAAPVELAASLDRFDPGHQRAVRIAAAMRHANDRPLALVPLSKPARSRGLPINGSSCGD